MLKNYLVVALRHLLRQKVYSFINVLSLSIGIAFCILTSHYVYGEWTYDTFHKSAGRIYRIYQSYKTPNNKERKTAFTPAPLAIALARDFPDIEKVVRFREEEGTVKYREKISVENLLFVDPEILEVFSFPLLRGDIQTALRDRASIVVSRATAGQYFGQDDPIGKRISVRIDEKYVDLVVEGVAAEAPVNSSIKFDFILPIERMPNYERWADFWGSSRVIAFALLREKANTSELARKFPGFVREHYWPSIQIYQEFGAMALSEDPLRIGLQALSDVHFDSEIRGGLAPTGDRFFSIVILGIAVTVLFVACFNFANISIALASNRVKEFGVRKVVGANGAQLLKQVWGEALLMSLIGLLVGIAFAELALPIFNDVVNKKLDLSYGSIEILSLVALGVTVGATAGIYPSIVLSRYDPVNLFIGNVGIGSKDIFSKSLLSGQFTASTFLIIFALVIVEQIDFVKSKDRGFQDKQVVIINASQVRKEQRSSVLAIYRSEFSNYPDVLSITASWRHFGVNTATTTVRNKGSTIDVQFFNIDPNFIQTLGLKLVTGRDFIQNSVADSEGSIIVNESLVRRLEWDSPIGKTIPAFGNRKVVGVVHDFHFRPLHHQIEPVVLKLAQPEILRYFYVRVSPFGIANTVNRLEQIWKEVNPDLPFQFSFLDEDIDVQYQADERWQLISRYGSMLSTFIACIGIFGLVALAIKKRVREIGIRKVLGASLWSVVFLLSKEYVKLAMYANLFTWPIAYFGAELWLENFAYNISPSVGVFIFSGLLALMAALLPVSYHAFRAATANPVDSLRYE